MPCVWPRLQFLASPAPRSGLVFLPLVNLASLVRLKVYKVLQERFSSVDAFTIAMLSLLAFFTIVTFGSLYLYNKHNQNRSDQ